MKIGILTFHRAHNYGAVLQCYALQKTLEELGHDVEVIDYRQPFIEHLYQVYRWDWIRGYFAHPLALYNYFKTIIPSRKMKRDNFGYFVSKYLNVSNQCMSLNIPQDYETYIIGSDQLWGINCLGGKLDPIYFGKFKHRESSKIVGYAISTNDKSLKSIPLHQLSEWLSNFQALSLREQSMSDLVCDFTRVRSHVDLDPTLLLNKEKWDFTTNIDWTSRKYILVYYVIRGFGEYAHKEILNQANNLARNIGAELIDLSPMNYTVEDFVMSFKHAQCVVTTSFHASVFSIIFNTPLYSVKLHDGNDDRYVNLLKSLSMESSLIEMDDNIDIIPQIDYEEVNKKLEDLRKPSFDYLRTNLS